MVNVQFGPRVAVALKLMSQDAASHPVSALSPLRPILDCL